MSNDISETSNRQRQQEQLLTQNTREAADKVAFVQKQTKQAIAEEQGKLDRIRDEYVKSAERESLRGEQNLEVTKRKGYEQVRDAQRMLAREESRVRQDGQRDVIKADAHYKEAIYNTHRKGEEDLRETQRKNFLASEFERKRAEHNMEASTKDHTQQIEMTKAQQDKALSDLKAASQMEYNRQRQSTDENLQSATSHFNKRYTQTIGEQQKALNALNAEAGRQLAQARMDSSRKLDAYSSRQEDPFYQLVRLGGELKESENAYEFRAPIPIHERDKVAVSIKGNSLLVTSQRRAEEKLETAPGKTVATHSYQSFSETYPISHPVEAKGLHKRFEGDELVVTIPKRFNYAPAPRHKGPNPEPARQDKPDFPTNIPIQPPVSTADPDAQPPPRRSGKTVS